MSEQMHWENVYKTKSADNVSWFRERATRSLEIIRSIGAKPDSQIIDVGGGGANLVDDLLADGFERISVLDLSASALDVARNRLGPKGDNPAGHEVGHAGRARDRRYLRSGRPRAMQRSAGGAVCTGATPW